MASSNFKEAAAEEEKKSCVLFFEEFNCGKFKLSMTPAELCAFGDSAMLGPKVFGVYRAITAFYFFVVMCWSISDYTSTGTGVYWTIYLTHWTLALEVVYLILAAFVTFKNEKIRSKVNPDEQFANIPPVVMLTWVLMNIAYVGSFIVFLMYWGLVYDGDTEIISVQTHGVNFLLMLIDVFLNGAPFRIMHLYLPMFYGALYSTFNYLYWAAGGTNQFGDSWVYEALDWSNAAETTLCIMVFLMFIAVPVFQTIFWWWWCLGNACSGEDSKWRKSLLGKEKGDGYASL